MVFKTSAVGDDVAKEVDSVDMKMTKRGEWRMGERGGGCQGVQRHLVWI